MYKGVHKHIFVHIYNKCIYNSICNCLCMSVYSPDSEVQFFLSRGCFLVQVDNIDKLFF